MSVAVSGQESFVVEEEILLDDDDDDDDYECTTEEIVEPDDLVSAIHASLMEYKTQQLEPHVAQGIRQRRSSLGGGMRRASMSDYSVEIVDDGANRTDAETDEDEYEEQVIEQWFRRDEMPDDLETACRTLIGIVFKEEDVDAETMMRRSPLPELYRYLKQHYDYKVHTEQVQDEEQQKETKQTSLQDIFRRKAPPADSSAAQTSGAAAASENGGGVNNASSSVGDTSVLEEEVLEPSMAAVSSEMEEEEEIILEDENFSEEVMLDETEVVVEDDEDDGADDVHEEEVVDDDDDDDDENNGDGVTLRSSDDEAVVRHSHSPLDTHSFDTDTSGPEILLNSGIGDDTTVSTFHNSTDDIYAVGGGESLTLDTDRRSRDRRRLKRDESQSSLVMKELLISVVPGMISVSNADTNINMGLDFDDQILQSWLGAENDNSNEPDDYEGACRQLIPVIYRGMNVDADVMVKRMPVRELYKYLKQHYWFVIHRRGTDDYASTKRFDDSNLNRKSMTIAEIEEDALLHELSNHRDLPPPADDDDLKAGASSEDSDSDDEADVTMMGASNQHIHVVLTNKRESSSEKNKVATAADATDDDVDDGEPSQRLNPSTRNEDDDDGSSVVYESVASLSEADPNVSSNTLDVSVNTMEIRNVHDDSDYVEEEHVTDEEVLIDEDDEDVVDETEVVEEEVLDSVGSRHDDVHEHEQAFSQDATPQQIQIQQESEIEEEDVIDDFEEEEIVVDEDDFVEEEVVEEVEEEDYGAEELLSDLRADLMAYRSENYS